MFLVDIKCQNTGTCDFLPPELETSKPQIDYRMIRKARKQPKRKGNVSKASLHVT